MWEGFATGPFWVPRMDAPERRLELSKVWERFANVSRFGRFWVRIAIWDPHFRTKSNTFFGTSHELLQIVVLNFGGAEAWAGWLD